MRQAVSRVVLAACAAALASCGGSGGGESSGSPTSPPTLTLVAGTLDAGGSGSADGTGTAARFSASDLALGADGNLYVADTYNGTIRRVTPAGVVTTPWGRAGEQASVDGSSEAARFWYPEKIIATPDGSLYVMETHAAVALLRRIAPDGTVATVLRFPDASVPTLDRIGTLVIDGARRLYFIDLDRCALHRVDLSKPVLETVASFPKTAVGCSIQAELRMDSDGNLYYVEGELGLGTLVMKKRWATGMVSTAFASPVDIKRFAVRPDGVVVFHDGTGVVYAAAPGGVPRQLSGTRQSHVNPSLVDGNADTARFSFFFALVADAANRVWTLEEGAVVRRLDTDGSVSTVAGRAPQDTLYRPGTGEQARLGTSFTRTALVADAAGNAYFTGPSLNNTAIARVTPEGVLSTFVGSAEERGTQDGTGMNARFGVIRALARDPMGALLVAEPRGTVSCGRHGLTMSSVVRKVGTDGSVRTLPYAFEGDIKELAPLAGRSMLVTGDHPLSTTDCATERKAVEVTEAGMGTPLAAALPVGPMAGNGSGNTWFINGGAIVKRFADGRLVLVAGSETEVGDRDGVGAQARFSMAEALDVDGAGNVYVADTGNGTVRKITPDGTVTTIVGRANQHGIVLGALPGGLDNPTAVAVTPQGLLIRSRAALLRASW